MAFTMKYGKIEPGMDKLQPSGSADADGQVYHAVYL